MRVVAVDVGSNTVHSLVADVSRGRLVDVAHYVEMPELGVQVARTGSIGSRARPALRALRHVVDRALSHGADHVVAGATQAVREAADGAAFVREASQIIGEPLRIIDPTREARLSFLGVASRHAWRRDWAMVDVGGASTEIVVATGREATQSVTLPMGSGVLAAKYFSDPPHPEERARLRRAALRELKLAPDGDVERLVATGGTASNLPFVLTRRTPPSALTTADLLVCEGRLDRGRASAVAEDTGLTVNRIKAMRGGLEVLLLVLDWYGLATLQISFEGLRHGMLLAYLRDGEDWWR